MIDDPEIIKLTEGWNYMIFDKCMNNTVTDVTTINMPAHLDKSVPNGEVYCYAAWMPPGHHQFLLYDPLHKRGFTKEVIIQ